MILVPLPGISDIQGSAGKSCKNLLAITFCWAFQCVSTAVNVPGKSFFTWAQLWILRWAGGKQDKGLPAVLFKDQFSEQVLELQLQHEPAEGQCPVPPTLLEHRRGEIICLWGLVRSICPDCLGEETIHCRTAGTDTDTEWEQKIKTSSFFHTLLARFLLLYKCQRKRSLLGEPCTWYIF